MKRDAPLDGLRGLAVLLVLASHSSNAGHDLVPGLDARGTGRAGVFLFFVLSSYLLTSQCLEAFDVRRERPDGGGRARYWARFAARRLLRILPAYALALGLYVALGAFTPEVALAHLALVRAEAHFWTIPVEVLFYALLPVLTVAVGSLRTVPLRLLALLISAVAARLAFPPDYPARPPDYAPHVAPFVPVFLVGSALAVLKPWLLHAPRRVGRALDLLGGLAVVGLLSMTPSLRELVTGEPVAHTAFHLHFDEFGLLFGLIVMASIPTERGVIARAASFRPLVGLGIISYSVYLLHAIVQSYAGSRSDSLGGWVGPLAFVGTLLAGAASFWAVERPFLRVWAQRRTTAPPGRPLPHRME